MIILFFFFCLSYICIFMYVFLKIKLICGFLRFFCYILIMKISDFFKNVMYIIIVKIEKNFRILLLFFSVFVN